jgi:hypothetical protein
MVLISACESTILKNWSLMMNPKTWPKRHARGYLPHAESRRSDMQSMSFMFTRDLKQGIMPSRYGKETPDYKVKLKNDDPTLEKQLITLLDISRSPVDDLSEAVAEFIDTCTVYMSYWGEIVFEILRNETSGEPEKLDPLPLNTVKTVLGQHIQLIPKQDAADDGKRFLRLPSGHIWRIALPRELGSVRKHRKMIRRLNELSNTTPQFTFEGLDFGARDGFEFDYHHMNRDIAIEQCTRRFGTIPSLGQLKYTMEYYFITNRLQTAHAKALLREHIIKELNSLLARLNIDNSVVVSGIPTVEDIRALKEELRQGKVSFAEAISRAKPLL